MSVYIKLLKVKNIKMSVRPMKWELSFDYLLEEAHIES